MKNPSVLIVIYFLALGLSFFGFIIDSENNKLVNQSLNVVLLSLLIFVILTGLVFLLYSLFVFFKTLIENKQLVN
jgi:uncharacterized protein (DUF486 family)